MTGMERTIEQVRQAMQDAMNTYGPFSGTDQAQHVYDYLHALGLLAPAPLREEWGRAYRQADGVLFVDDQDGSFRDSDDVAQFVPPQHPDSPYDLIVKRGVTDWMPVERAKADAMNRQNTVVLARDVEAAAAAGYPRHRWCVVTPRNIKIGPRGMQARYAVAVDLTEDELTEMLVHDSVSPAFLWAGEAEVVRITAEGDGSADQ